MRDFSKQNLFPPLTAAYLLVPNLIFLLWWVRPAIGLPVAAGLVTAYVFFVRQARDWQPQNPVTGKNLVLVLVAALVFTVMTGIGGFLPQTLDYIKHNLLYHDLVHEHWPVSYATEQDGAKYLCYGLGYYLVPALAGRWLGDGWMPVLTFLWGLGGVTLAFYWFATLGKNARIALCFFFAFSVTGVLLYPLKQLGIPGYLPAHDLRDLLSVTGLYHSYHDNFSKIYYQPQHGLTAWLGTALLFEWLWLRKDARPGMFLWSLCVFWSPLTSLGLLLIPLAAIKKTGVGHYFTPINFASGLLLAVLAIYFQGHVPLTQKGFIFQMAPPGECLILYLSFLLLELNVLFVLLLLDWKYQMLRGFRPLFYVMAAALILMPLIKVGACADLRLQAGTPAILIIAMAAWLCFQHAQFKWKSPLGLLLVVCFALGAVYPMCRPLVMRVVEKKIDYAYPALVKERGLTRLSDYRQESGVDAASQYFGQSNSVAARFLLR